MLWICCDEVDFNRLFIGKIDFKNWIIFYLNYWIYQDHENCMKGCRNRLNGGSLTFLYLNNEVLQRSALVGPFVEVLFQDKMDSHTPNQKGRRLLMSSTDRRKSSFTRCLQQTKLTLSSHIRFVSFIFSHLNIFLWGDFKINFHTHTLSIFLVIK